MLNLYENTDGLIHLYKSSNFQSFSAWVLNAVVMFSSCNLLLRLPVLLRSQIIFDTHLWFFWFVHKNMHLLLFVSLFMCGPAQNLAIGYRLYFSIGWQDFDLFQLFSYRKALLSESHESDSSHREKINFFPCRDAI